MAFYENLGFAVEDRNDGWGWAMLRCGDCQIMLDQSINLHPGIPRISVLYLYPQSLVKFRRHALDRGLPVPALEETFYGMTEFAWKIRTVIVCGSAKPGRCKMMPDKFLEPIDAHMYIPTGFSTVTPYLFVKDAESFVEFLINAFGAVEELRSLRPDARIANVQLRVGTSMLMASEAGGRYPPMPTAFYLYVEDADKAMARAIAAGAVLEMAVGDMPYGDRQGGVRDPHGNIWWLSQRLVPAPYSA